MFAKLKQIVSNLKKEIIPIYYSLFDRRTPVIAKIFALLAVGYLLSPIDLIPDFIPILGQIDDLIVVPILIKIAVSLIPKYIMEDIKSKIDVNQRLPKAWYYAIPIILIYILIALLTYKYFVK